MWHKYNSSYCHSPFIRSRIKLQVNTVETYRCLPAIHVGIPLCNLLTCGRPEIQFFLNCISYVISEILQDTMQIVPNHHYYLLDRFHSCIRSPIVPFLPQLGNLNRFLKSSFIAYDPADLYVVKESDIYIVLFHRESVYP